MAILRISLVLVICFLSITLSYPKEYTRIVSLAPSVTKSLYELGAECFVKGITIFCPKGTEKKEIIGTLLEPNIEKIAYIKPDLIIASKDGNSKVVVNKLQRLGFEVYVMEKSENFKDICINYYNLAQKINKVNEATNIIATANIHIDTLYSKLSKGKILTVFWEIGSNSLYTAGNKSFANDYNAYSNTLNVYRDINKSYFQVSMEDVLNRNPDIIFLVNAGNIPKEELSLWRKSSLLNVVKNNRVFIVDSQDMFTPTPLRFVENLSLLLKIIYGDSFDIN
jgi:iron complex transport system substrate-binding protein